MEKLQAIKTEHSLRRLTIVTDAIHVLMGSLLLALCSQIAFFLPFTPIPVTLQTCALFLMGLTLGPKKGALAVLLYLAEGALGLPVFASGHAGLAVVLGPRGGYLAGFILAAAITGWLAEKGQSFLKLWGTFSLANASIFTLGLAWLGIWSGGEQLAFLGLA